MKQFLNIVLLLLVIFIDRSTSVKQPVKSREDALAWLNKFGYNPCLNAKVQCSLSYSSILQDYQKRFRLKVTGKLDERTKEHMNRPRCGIPDKPIAELNSAAKLTSKWSRSSLTYSLRGFPTQLSQSSTETIIRQAFNAWLDYIPLNIEKACSTCQADFVLDFLRDEHADGYPFDGVGGTLAHAFFPENGRVHFDRDESWTESFNSQEYNLYLVAVHEIGHALGLDHVYNEKSIMYPSYQLMQKSSILPQPDQQAIQNIYGKKGSSPKISTTTRPTTTTTWSTRRTVDTTRSTATNPGGRSNSLCKKFLEAAFNYPDGTFHTFHAGYLQRYLPNKGTWEKETSVYSQTYPKLPRRIRAGAYNSQTNEVLFFTDTYYYQYEIDNQNRPKLRKEKELARNLQNSIIGAIYYHNQIHVVTKETLRLFQPDNAFQRSHQRKLAEEFPRLSGTVRTAFSSGDLHYFFTYDGLVSVWSERLNSWKTLAKPMESNWFACLDGQKYFATNDAHTRKLPKHRNSHRHYQHHHYD